MGALNAEDLRSGVGVGVEVDESDRPARCGDGTDIGLGDRVVAAEHDRDRAGRDDLPHRVGDRGMARRRVRGQNGGVTEVDDSKCRERVDAGDEVASRGRARRADRARCKARPGAI